VTVIPERLTPAERILRIIDRRGGIAATRELRAEGVDRDMLDIAVQYGRVMRVRKGWWARPEMPRLPLLAHRAGGRLACVSALEYHGIIEPVPGRVHISAPAGVSRWRPGQPRSDAIRHWSRRVQPGDRMAVTVDVAWEQFALCREVASRDVRLTAADSL
jgi:hypothetical protein